MGGSVSVALLKVRVGRFSWFRVVWFSLVSCFGVYVLCFVSLEMVRVGLGKQ